MSCVFFFSSRRRHTRYIGDWSSDVCSSDLAAAPPPIPFGTPGLAGAAVPNGIGGGAAAGTGLGALSRARSEERRVGKECRARGRAGPLKKDNVKMQNYI